MNSVKLAMSGFAAGAALMYLTDPDRGKRRRALLRDRSVRAMNGLSCFLDKAQRDAANRAEGVFSTVGALFRNRPVSDYVLLQRVRSRLGRAVSHPHAIEVNCNGGRIVLKGPVLDHEVPRLMRCVRAVPGVMGVENKLDVHHSSENISSLQGGVRRESRSEIMQQNWTPSLRIAAAAAGGTLISYGLVKGGPLGVASGAAGAALLGRAVFNREFRDIVGVGDGTRAVECDKTIHIQAPVEEVFKFLSDFQKLPRFMTHLKEVRELGNRRLHWVAEGPGGIPVSWDADITEFVPNKLLAWRSVPGSKVDTEGVVRFDENANGGTRVGIRMFYKPPAGVLGHYIASLFGADPKSELDDDMVRLKSLLELGKTHAHGVEVRRESLQPGPAPGAV
jgi:uncharacterized membrane protein